ncbi:MAG: tetratricopeptide repeat protein [Euryarchaeota archaeon]|nr:tetratricopeptide repeat protein [Euryarchaeota archaeon]
MELDTLTRIGGLLALTSQFESATATYLEALRMAGDPLKKAAIHRSLSDVQMQTGDLDDAMRTIDDGLRLVGPETAVHWLLRLQNVRGLIYKGELREAAAIGERAMERLAGLKVPDRDVSSSHNALGAVYIKMGDFARAREQYLKVLESSGRANDLAGMANGYNNLGATYQWTGDLEGAVSNYKKSLTLWEKLGNLYGISSTLSNIGVALTDMGDFDRVLDYHNRSLAIRRKIGNLEGVGISLSNIGATHYRRGELDKALPYMRESLDIRLRLNDRMGIGNSYNNLGDLFLWKGDVEAALDYMLKGLAIEEEIGDQEGVAFSQAHAGVIYIEMGEAGPAREMLEKGLATSREIGLNEYALVALRGLVEACIAANDLPCAEGHLAEAERLTAESELDLDGAATGRVRGLFLAAKGNYAAAIGSLEASERQFAKLGAAIPRAQALYNLGSVLSESGDDKGGTARLREALAEAERLGLSRMEKKCRERLD